jgi:23S rRNA pseudouridine1911/1915/1917 synthase
MVISKKHIVGEITDRIRMSDYLLMNDENILGEPVSRNFVKSILKSGCVTLNGITAYTGNWVKSGQMLEITLPIKNPAKIYKMPLPVIYEDNFFAVINKPAGIVVSGNRYKTIENALPYNLKPSNQPDSLAVPLPVHRLDALTSGLLIIAKTRFVRRKLGDMLANHQIQKTYRALVTGIIPDEGCIDLPLNNKIAITKFKTVTQIRCLIGDWLALVELYPQTGRKHQIRQHLLSIGCPVLGDKIYSKDDRIFKGKGLFLCATELNFLHPISFQDLHLHVSEPNKFKLHLERENRIFMKYHSQ